MKTAIKKYDLNNAGRIMKVVHVRSSVELAGSRNARDAIDRTTEVNEFQGGVLQATTACAQFGLIGVDGRNPHVIMSAMVWILRPIVDACPSNACCARCS